MPHALLEQMLRRLPEGARVLDAGSSSGTPEVVKFAASKPIRVTYLDSSDTSLWCAPGQRVLANICSLPFPDGTFDSVVAYHVHLFEDRGFSDEALYYCGQQLHADVAASELARVLAPGGWCCLTTKDPDLLAGQSPLHVEQEYREHGRAQVLLRR
jgi:SAM-dependent methyltransferase